MRVVILCIAMMVSASVWAQSASSKAAEFKLNPEYDAIIAEAKKLGKEPIDFAIEKKKSGEWDIKQYVAFAKYRHQLDEKAAKEDEAEIAEIRKEKEEYQKRNIEKIKEVEALKAAIFIQFKKFISLFTSFEKLVDPQKIKKINEIYCGGTGIAISTEMKTAIEKHLIKYIDTATCAATKLKLLTHSKEQLAPILNSAKDGSFSSYEIEEINIIYHSPYTFPEIKAEIEQKLGKYLTPAKKQPKQ